MLKHELQPLAFAEEKTLGEVPTHVAGRSVRQKRGLVIPTAGRYATGMFSHIVIFWTKADPPNAAEALIAGAEQHLKPIPGVLVFHVGRMVTDGRPVVESSYQVALATVFASRQAREEYRAHPGHERFKQEVYVPNCARCLIYDFE
jgi:stress responsive alpha/beta barrel protein